MKKIIKFGNKGFTLIELLVVIAIIGLLATIVMVSVNSARAKARDAKRKGDMRSISLALEMYYDTNGNYPSTGGAWWGVCVNGGSRATSGASAYISGLTPTYISVLPVDPNDDRTGWSGYIYQSNGTDYKLLCHANGPESFPSSGQPLYDSVRPTWAWAIYTSGGASW